MSTTMTVEALSLEVLQAAHDEARAHVRETADARPTGGDSTPAGALRKARAELAFVLANDAEKQAAHALAIALDVRELTGPVGDCIESLEAAEARATAIKNELQRIDVAAVATLRALAARLAESARARAGQGLPSPRIRIEPGPWPLVISSLKTPPATPGPDPRLGQLRHAEREATLTVARLDAERRERERERAEAEGRDAWSGRARNQEAAERAVASLAEGRAARQAEDALIAAFESGVRQ